MAERSRHLLITPWFRLSRSWGEGLARGDISRHAAELIYCVYSAASDDQSQQGRADSVLFARTEADLRAAVGEIRRGSIILDSVDWSADVRTLRLIFQLASEARIPVVTTSRALEPSDNAVLELWKGIELILLDHPRDRDELGPAVAAGARCVYLPRPPTSVLDSTASARARLGVADSRQLIFLLDDGSLLESLLPSLLEQLEAWKELSFSVVVLRATEREISIPSGSSLMGALIALRLRIVAEDPLTAISRYLSAGEVLLVGSAPRGIHRFALEQALANGITSVAYGASAEQSRSIFGAAVPYFSSVGEVIARCSQLARSPEARKPFRDHAESWVRTRADKQNELVGLPESADEPVFASASSAAPIIEKSSLSRGSDKREIRLLMVPREKAKELRGGDLVVMEELAAELPSLGINVTVDWDDRERISDYDVVQLFNFALRDDLQNKARRCAVAGIPYTVATFYEDWPKFFTKMSATYFAMKAYVDAGQRPEMWPEIARIISEIAPSEIWDNSWTANNAAGLLVSGEEEARIIRRDYPLTKRIAILPVGCQPLGKGDGGELFTKETGLKDVILSVGRFEARKNQLMIMKALEEDEYPLVFIGGGATVQPEYRELCKRFRRRGKTVFLDRLSPELLASAYGAARVHVLPSWYELPGIVSMEAAVYGCNIVTSDYGTPREYFGDFAFYCDPQSPESVRSAINQAYNAPRQTALGERMLSYTWRRSAEAAAALYREILR